MSDMVEKVWELHDKRLNEHELRFNQGTRDFQEIKDVLRQLSERLNEGVSKTQQKLLEDNKSIELGLRDLKHAVELNTTNMNNKIDIVEDNLNKRIKPLEDSSERLNKIYVWSILSGVIGGLVLFGSTKVFERIWPKETQVHSERSGRIERIQDLKARQVNDYGTK